MLKILNTVYKSISVNYCLSSSSRINQLRYNNFRKMSTSSDTKHLVAVCNIKVTNDKKSNLEQVKESIKISKEKNATVSKQYICHDYPSLCAAH